MRRTLIRALLTLGLFLPSLVPPEALAPAQRSDGQPAQAVLQPNGGQGLASGGGYLSRPTEAAHPFTHMLLRRDAHVPEGAELILAVRVSLDGANWTDWREIDVNDDLWQES